MVFFGVIGVMFCGFVVFLMWIWLWECGFSFWVFFFFFVFVCVGEGFLLGFFVLLFGFSGLVLSFFM